MLTGGLSRDGRRHCHPVWEPRALGFTERVYVEFVSKSLLHFQTANTFLLSASLGPRRSSLVYRSVRRLTCGPWAASSPSCSWAGRSTPAPPSTTRWVQAAQAFRTVAPVSLRTGHAGGLRGLCRLPDPAPLNLAFLSFFFFLSPFSLFTPFFPCNIVFFSKALEPLIYHMQGDRKLSDLVLLFSCRFGIFHKHRVCQLNIY